MSVKIQCILAKYKEDLGWTKLLPWPVLVYDKSPDPSPGAVPLPNLGREGHSYLWHITRHYHDLAEVNVFLQGDPFLHLNHGPEELVERVAELAERGTPFKGLAWFTLKCDALGRPHDMREDKARRWAGYGKDIPVGELYAKLFAGPAPEKYHAKAPAGLFLVRRERVHTRPWGFYQRALELLEADPRDADNTGHALERLWSLIFNGYAALNRDDYPVEPTS